MKFEVEFNPESFEHGFAVDMDRRELGLADLDRIRKKLKTPVLPGESVEPYIEPWSPDPTVEISEHHARMSGHFETRQRIKVVPQAHLLNRFVSEEIIVNKSSEDGGIISVRLRYAIDVDAVITAWAKAGYPLLWEKME